jgi:CRP/FNR family transcriptional regulator
MGISFRADPRSGGLRIRSQTLSAIGSILAGRTCIWSSVTKALATFGDHLAVACTGILQGEQQMDDRATTTPNKQDPILCNGKPISIPFAEKLTPEGRDLLSRSSRWIDYPKGSMMKSEGDMPDYLPILQSGAVRVFKSSPDGKKLTLYGIKPGGSCMLAAFCILKGVTYLADAVVDQSSDAILISAEAFRRLHAQEKAVQDFVLDLGLSRIMNLIMIVEEVAFRKMNERLALFLIQKASTDQSQLQPVRMSHQEIATELGTVREVISRLLQEFEALHFVHLGRRNIEIIDLQGLQYLVEGDRRFDVALRPRLYGKR